MEILIAIVVVIVSYFFGTFPSAAIVAGEKILTSQLLALVTRAHQMSSAISDGKLG